MMVPMNNVQKSVVDEDEVDCVLDADIEFSGTIESDRSLLVKGRVSGRILCGEELYIAETADIDAEIEAAQVIIRGRVRGSVKASQCIQVLEESDVKASLDAPEIFVENDGTDGRDGDD